MGFYYFLDHNLASYPSKKKIWLHSDQQRILWAFHFYYGLCSTWASRAQVGPRIIDVIEIGLHLKHRMHPDGQ
jgi:hypothetical protein